MINNWQPEGNGLQPLFIGLTILIDLYLLDQCFLELTFFFFTHQSIQSIKIHQNLIDIVPAYFLGLDCLPFCLCINQALFLLINLIIHTV